MRGGGARRRLEGWSPACRKEQAGGPPRLEACNLGMVGDLRSVLQLDMIVKVFFFLNV